MVAVAKFGGAAMGAAESIQATARIVGDYDEPVAVVVSAMSGVTDALVALAHNPDTSGRKDAADLIRKTHRDVLDSVGGDEQSRASLDAVFDGLVARIGADHEPNPEALDAIVTVGERASVILLTAALQNQGTSAIALDAAGAGVRTNGPFGHARPIKDLDASIHAALSPHLSRGDVPVITGFYGVDENGAATIFGRGGSDYVAALVASGLNASCMELWKDVPGFLTADPRAVGSARLVPELDYGEAAELAYFGAKVLHPRCVEPIQDRGIPIHIRTFTNPSATGTVIHANAARPRDAVRSAASRDGLAVVRLNGPGMGHTPGIGERVFHALAQANVNVLNMANSQATFALLIDDANAVVAEAALRPLLGGSIRTLEVLRDRSLVCVVGRGLGEGPGGAARIFNAVSQQDVNIEMISLGASEIAIDFIVPSADRAAALNGLHDTFLAGAP